MTGLKLKTTAGGGTSFPVGLYQVRLKDLIEETIQNPRFGDGNRIRWVFLIEDVIDSDDDKADEKVGEELWAWTSYSMARKATARKYAEALNGEPIADDVEFDIEQLKGKRAKANIVPREDDPERTTLGALTPHKGTKRGARGSAEDPF